MHVIGRLVEPIWTRIQLPCRIFSTMTTNVYKLSGGNCVEPKWRSDDCVQTEWRRLSGDKLSETAGVEENGDGFEKLGEDGWSGEKLGEDGWSGENEDGFAKLGETTGVERTVRCSKTKSRSSGNMLWKWALYQ